MHKKVIAQAVGLMVFGGLLVGVAQATGQSAAPPAASSLSVEGVQVAIDPATGRLVAPTAAQRAELSRAMLQRAASGATSAASAGPRNAAEAKATLRTLRLGSGRTVVSMELPQDLMSSLVAERHADGTLTIHHAGDAPAPAAVEVTQ